MRQGVSRAGTKLDREISPPFWQISLGVLDEILALPSGAMRRAIYGVMPSAERDHHG